MDIAASLIKLFFGSKADKDRKEVEPYLVKIKAVYPTIEALSNDELRAHSSNLKKQIANFIAADEARIVELKARLELPDTSLSDKEKISKEIDETVKRIDEKIEQKLDELLPEAFAIMKDTARRFAQNETVEVTANDFDRELAATKDFVKIEGDKAIYATHWLAGGNDVRWDMIHYDVQLFGGVVLHKGKIAEMATGEGKTLVATLPVFLNALAGKGVHMVTVNDYLARRDSEWMGPMYQFHGLTVDCIDRHQPNSDARRKAYMADITFGTNNEYGFDYLRDNMASSPKDLVQRKHHYAIVDEVDSVLIDDARTPLIISGPVPKGDDQLFEQYRPAIEHLYNLQKNLVTNLLAESRQLLGEGKNEEGGIKLYRSHKGLPKYKPLIKFLSEQGIKAQMQKTENIYMQDNNRRMPEITDDLYFVIDEKMNSVELTDKGHEALSKYFNEEGFFVLPDIGARIAEIEKEEITPEEKAQKRDAVINDYAVKAERVHTVIQLLKAYAMFEKDVEYVVMDNKVKIVDEQTGRILDGRRYSDGLHQAIEAKERVKVEAATQTFATITLQNYFRMYHKLAGMTGTAETEASEFWSIYKLDVVVIPTNRKVIRDDRQDLVYKTKREKYNAVIEEIVKLVEQGRPVLVGTTSVEISELLSRMLKLRGIKHNVLNAKQHQLEAQIVAEAGRSGQVTIATNMAGRGTDILLGGNAEEMTRDELMGYDFGIDAEVLDRVLHEANWRLLGKDETELEPVERSVFNRVFEGVRVLGIDVDTATFAQIARTYEEVMAKTRAVCRAEHDQVVEAGGLTVIGTERHESRRIDNQLRGRAGRQGDPGETQFYLSLEDDLMRMFGGDRMDKISNLMVATEMGDDQPIQHKMISKAVEGAQRKVENINFSMRKNVLEYDDVMNKQRQVIYAERNKILDGKDLSDHIDEVIADTIKRCVTEFCPVDSHEGERDLEGLHKWVVELTGRPDAPQFADASYTELCDAVLAFVEKAYDAKAERLGESLMQELNCQVMLRVIDTRWMGYLQEMDYLKQGIGLRGFGQRDPLVEYKTEAFRAFQMLVDTMYEDYLRPVRHAEFKNPEVARARIEGERNPALAGARMSGPAEVDGDTGSSTIQRQAAQQAATAGAGRAPQGAAGNAGATVRTYRKDQSGDPYANVGRNDPCPCGSGKKFKNCHGRNR